MAGHRRYAAAPWPPAARRAAAPQWWEDDEDEDRELWMALEASRQEDAQLEQALAQSLAEHRHEERELAAASELSRAARCSEDVDEEALALALALSAADGGSGGAAASAAARADGGRLPEAEPSCTADEAKATDELRPQEAPEPPPWMGWEEDCEGGDSRLAAAVAESLDDAEEEAELKAALAISLAAEEVLASSDAPASDEDLDADETEPSCKADEAKATDEPRPQEAPEPPPCMGWEEDCEGGNSGLAAAVAESLDDADEEAELKAVLAISLAAEEVLAGSDAPASDEDLDAGKTEPSCKVDEAEATDEPRPQDAPEPPPCMGWEEDCEGGNSGLAAAVAESLADGEEEAELKAALAISLEAEEAPADAADDDDEWLDVGAQDTAVCWSGSHV